jgi:hypothetical protein
MNYRETDPLRHKRRYAATVPALTPCAKISPERRNAWLAYRAEANLSSGGDEIAGYSEEA